MCTGGASANPAMMQQYFPNYTEYGENCGISTTDGKGLQMCWDVGAAKGLFGLHAHNHTMPLSAKYAGVDTVLGLDDISTMGNVPLLWLNLEGERIGKETWAWSPTPGGNIVAYGKRLFNVFDQATVDHCVQNGSPVRAWRGKRDQPLPDLQQQLAAGTALGYVFKGNTIAELSAKIGWNPDVAAEQIARYNQIVENQLDTDHYKEVEALVFKVETAPFYAIEIRPRYLGTFGGLIVSKDYEVLKENDHPIPGLYAAGDNASGWYGRLYPNIGGLTSQHNTTSGYTASLSAIEYIRG
jgi:fumarate reductase flavoprotein subunit